MDAWPGGADFTRFPLTFEARILPGPVCALLLQPAIRATARRGFQRFASRFPLLARWIRGAAFEPVPPQPLAIYRITFSMVVLAEFLHLVHRRDLVFLEFPLRDSLPPGTGAMLALWGIAIVFLILGLATPLAALVNYHFVVTWFRPNAPFCYHADMLYVPAALLLIALPSWRCWSLDAVLLRRAFDIDWSRTRVPRLYQNVVILCVMGLMYFDSTLAKLQSPFWLDGLGFWLPSSFPAFTTMSWNSLLNHEILVKAAGYLTLVFELVFVFLFWIPPLRLYLLVIGLVLHLGIAIVLPIPLFGLLMVVHYACFLPLRAAPAEAPFLRFDLALGKLLLGVAALAVMVQATLIVRGESSDTVFSPLGLTRHAVFTQNHFQRMTRDVALAYYDKGGQEHWIPWVTRSGHIGSEGYGRFWTAWWVNSLPGEDAARRAFWARAAEAWAKREGYKLEEGEVRVKTRPVNVALLWERDRQRRLEQTSWSDLLTITWPEGRRHYSDTAPF